MKKKWLIIVCVLLFVLGFGCILAGTKNEELMPNVDKEIVFIIQAAGFISVLLSVLVFYRFISVWVKSDEEMSREEEDERNIMIRGKAAENTQLITAIVMLGVELLFICMGYTVPALILAVGLFICQNVHVFIVAYYQKKY